MQSSRDPSLSLAETAAWRGFLHAYSVLVRELDRELEAEHGLPLHQYEVLLVLWRSECGRMRMSELADQVFLSQSGLTRLVDRLEQAGLVTRQRCEMDRRGLWASITDTGRARLEAARVTHLDGVRTRFLDRFSEAELDMLADAWERIVAQPS